MLVSNPWTYQAASFGHKSAQFFYKNTTANLSSFCDFESTNYFTKQLIPLHICRYSESLMHSVVKHSSNQRNVVTRWRKMENKGVKVH